MLSLVISIVCLFAPCQGLQKSGILELVLFYCFVNFELPSPEFLLTLTDFLITLAFFGEDFNVVCQTLNDFIVRLRGLLSWSQ